MGEPGYLKLYRNGDLANRVRAAYRRLLNCDLCAHRCYVNRRETIKGAVCRTGEHAVVASFHPHFGEEGPLVGAKGSGTIFFAWCNLRCQYCQNYEISQLGEGEQVEPPQIAAMMLRLQAEGCHNINLVSPSHVIAPTLAAIYLAAQAGLRVPIVYNTGGYDAVDALALLDGIVDIYMPDLKYADADMARAYSKIHDYPAINHAVVKEMYRQVGNLQVDERGIATRGLITRHLILPDDRAQTRAVLQFIAEEISRDTYVNLMDQYHPCYKASEYPALNRRITREEFDRAVAWAGELGLTRLDR